MADLGTLGGSAAQARDIDNEGRVVGSSQRPVGGFVHAFLRENGQMQDPALAHAGSRAEAINDRGQIVGTWDDPVSGVGQVSSAFLWQQGAAAPLNRLLEDAPGWHVEMAMDINLRGQIVARAHQNGAFAIVLLSPVP